jgi:hypothetical protein
LLIKGDSKYEHGGFQLKWLEIIELRVNTSNLEQVASELERIVKEHEVPANNLRISLYRHAYIETDFSVHLVHDSIAIPSNGSLLGRHLNSVLSEFGIIHRALWRRINEQDR